MFWRPTFIMVTLSNSPISCRCSGGLPLSRSTLSNSPISCRCSVGLPLSRSTLSNSPISCRCSGGLPLSWPACLTVLSHVIISSYQAYLYHGPPCLTVLSYVDVLEWSLTAPECLLLPHGSLQNNH